MSEEENTFKASMPLLKNKEIRYIDNNFESIIDKITKASIHNKDLAVAQYIIEKQQAENKNLKQILEAGLNKENQYCFYNEDSSDKCMGYSNYNDDEPCDYCKSCERLGDDK